MSDLTDNEEDPSRLWAEIHTLRTALQGPEGYATWQDAATAERVRRVRAEKALVQPTAHQADAPSELLRQVFALCEATEDRPAIEPKNEHERGFDRGRRFEAKQIRRGIGTWFQDTYCGRSHMGEPMLAPQADALDAARVPLTDEQMQEALHLTGPSLLELAKQWADNKIHVYQFSSAAEFIVKGAIERAYGIGAAALAPQEQSNG